MTEEDIILRNTADQTIHVLKANLTTKTDFGWVYWEDSALQQNGHQDIARIYPQCFWKNLVIAGEQQP